MVALIRYFAFSPISSVFPVASVNVVCVPYFIVAPCSGFPVSFVTVTSNRSFIGKQLGSVHCMFFHPHLGISVLVHWALHVPAWLQ